MRNKKYILSLQRLNENKCATLTGFLVFFIMLSAFFPPNSMLFQAATIGYYFVLISTPYFISAPKKLFLIAILCGVFMLIPRVLLMFDIYPNINIIFLNSKAATLVLVAFELLLTIAIVGYTTLDTRPEGPISGCVLTYILIGITFGDTYFLINRFFMHSFGFLGNVHDFVPTWADMQYFSFITLTSTGYGDIIPISHPARMLSGVEACVGVLYVAVFVGRIINRRIIETSK